MTAFIYAFLGCLIIAGLISGIRALIRWANNRVEHDVAIALGEQAADWNEPTRAHVEATYGPRILWGPTDTATEADHYWNNFADITDANTLPLSTSPVAQRIREQIADGECRRLRNQLDAWGGEAS